MKHDRIGDGGKARDKKQLGKEREQERGEEKAGRIQECEDAVTLPWLLRPYCPACVAQTAASEHSQVDQPVLPCQDLCRWL